MLFIGLVWMLSFWSSFLSSSQGVFKAPDSSFNTLPAKRWPTFGSEGEKSRFSFAQLPLTSGVWGSSFTPTVALSLNWPLNLGRSSSKPKRVKSFVRSLTSSVPVDNVLCQADPVPAGQLIRFVQPTPQRPASFDIGLPNRPDEQNTQPQKNAGLLPNFVPWYLSKFDSSSSASEPTVVVRSKYNDQSHSDRAKVGYRKLLNFWHHSRSKSNRASAESLAKQNSFQIWLKGYLIAEMPDRAAAQLMGDRLEEFLKQPGWAPSQLQLSLVNETVELKAGDRLLVAIDDNLAAKFNHHRELLAIDWLNNLRIALGTTPLSLVEAQTQMHGLVETGENIEGLASWYGPYFHGRLTATGEIYDQNDFTAAHPSLPFDTYLKVTNLNNGKEAIVRVNDRGPYVGDRALDLSQGAAFCINSIDSGVVPIRAVLMQPASAKKKPLSGQRLAGS